MKYWYDKETGMKMCEPDCVDEWLFDIWAIGCDYDGCNTVDELKELIDELVDMTQKARECLWHNQLFGEHGSPKNDELYAEDFWFDDDDDCLENWL